MSCIKNVALVEPLVDVVDPKQVNCTHAKLKTFNIETGMTHTPDSYHMSHIQGCQRILKKNENPPYETNFARKLLGGFFFWCLSNSDMNSM